MADHCAICDTRRPEGGTKLIVNGTNWLEFCSTCGDKDDTVEVPGHPEVRTFNQLFEFLGKEE